MDKKVSGPQQSIRPRSSQEIRFLKESENIRCGNRTSWRERVRPIQRPTSATNKTLKRPPSAAGNNDSPLQPFELGQIPGDWSSRDIHVCVNGKLSESPESAELTRSFARWKRTGSVQAEEDNEDSLLEEVLGLENLLLTEPCQTTDDQLRQKKVPLCWDDLDGTTFNSRSPEENGTDLLMNPQETSREVKTTGDDVKQPSTVPAAYNASHYKESSLALEVMVTWVDQCLLPWQPVLTSHSPVDMKHVASTVVDTTSTSPHLEVGGRYFGSPEHSSGYQLVENILGKSKGAGRLIGVTKQCHLDDLLCLWLRWPPHGDKVQSVKLETCSFSAYLSETLNSKASTRVFKEMKLRKVVHNLYVLKFHLVPSLPWVTDAIQLPGRAVGVSLYVSRPQRLEGLVFSEWITITPSPHSPSPPGIDQPSPTHSKHRPPTSRVPAAAVEQDEDKMTFAMNNAVLDTASQQAQEFILSFYQNPYQVGAQAQESEQRSTTSGRRLHVSQVKRDPTPYTSLVQRHLGRFLDKNCSGKAAGSERHPHIQVCSHPLHTASKQKRTGKRRCSPRVVMPACDALGAECVSAEMPFHVRASRIPAAAIQCGAEAGHN